MSGIQIVLVVFLLVYGLSMLFILLYGLTQGTLLWSYLRNKRQPQPTYSELKTLPAVTIQLPVYNELYVVERLIEAAAAIDYPQNLLEIQVLDDSNDASVELIARKVKELQSKGLDTHHIRREDRTDYKAGALRYGLTKAKGEYIAVFDADFIPPQDFLQQTLPYFQDEKVGVVQTRWGHLNKDHSLLTYLQAFALDAHFTIEQVGREQGGCFINFNGTGGIWRKSCIIDAGNWEADTLTEDLDLSYRAQLKGWKFKYLEDVCSPAELPPVISAMKSQQYRWTKGGAETAKKHLRSILAGKLSWKQKWHSAFHLLNSTVFVAVILAALVSVPLMMLKGEWAFAEQVFWVGYVFYSGFILIALMYFVSFYQSQRNIGFTLAKYLVTFPLFLAVSLGLSAHNALAVLEGLKGKKTAFIRTPKFNLKSRGNAWKVNSYIQSGFKRDNYLELILLMYFSGALVWSFVNGDLGMLPFHGLMFLGLAIVNVYTFRQLYMIRRSNLRVNGRVETAQ